MSSPYDQQCYTGTLSLWSSFLAKSSWYEQLGVIQRMYGNIECLAMLQLLTGSQGIMAVNEPILRAQPEDEVRGLFVYSQSISVISPIWLTLCRITIVMYCRGLETDRKEKQSVKIDSETSTTCSANNPYTLLAFITEDFHWLMLMQYLAASIVHLYHATAVSCCVCTSA